MGETKIIAVANQKGGAGKSTLCMLLANYLHDIFGVRVGAIIDTDFQKSIVKKRESDIKRLEGAELDKDKEVKYPSYQVVSFLLSNREQIPAFIRQLRNTGHSYIIDTPGTLSENGLITILMLADFILCPFDYDDLTLSATTEFLMFYNKFKEKIQNESGVEIKTRIIMVPCRRPPQKGTKTEKDIWALVKDAFAKLYDITPEIPNLAAISRADTIALTPEQLAKSVNALDYIANLIYNPNNDNKDDQEE